MSFTTVAYILFLSVVATVWNCRRDMSPWFLCCCSLLFYGYWFPPYALILLACAWLSHMVARRVLAPGAIGLWPFSLVLPLGISFYTFQALSYVLDVRSLRLASSHSARDYLTYLLFFPQLVAGPIVRATHFLPQLAHRTRLTRKDLRAALYHLGRGFFMKVAIADNLAASVGLAFDGDPSGISTNDAWLGAVMFGTQIFCDFAGYSEIAIGSARLLGFKLQRNFNNPHLAVGVQEFWRRWHISLSTWFRDYVYIPLGGNRTQRLRRGTNILLVFLLSGLWHGAGLQYILWGGLHGCWVLLERWMGRLRLPQSMTNSVVYRPLLVAATFTVITVSWVPFRSANIGQALHYWAAMFWMNSGPCTLLNESALAGLVLFSLLNIWSFPSIRRRLPANVRSWDSAFFVGITVVMPGQGVDFIYFQF